jgi:hypothetical protein
VKRAVVSLVALAGAAMAVAACNGTTGDQLITFPVYAAGAKGAGEPFTAGDWTIQLTYAHMYVGAIYVNEAPAQYGSTFNTPSCVDEGVYCGQVTTGLDVDLLNSSPQPFPVQGNGSADLGQSWALYLVDGDVNAPQNNYVTDVNGTHEARNTADLQGTATGTCQGKPCTISWYATITINVENRGVTSPDPGQPGLDPICHQRIVNFGALQMQFYQGGQMLLTIDPRRWFPTAPLPIDFSTLPLVSSATSNCNPDGSTPQFPGSPEYCIPDSSNLGGGVLGSQQGQTLFSALSTAGSAGFNLTYSPSP